MWVHRAWKNLLLDSSLGHYGRVGFVQKSNFSQMQSLPGSNTRASSQSLNRLYSTFLRESGSKNFSSLQLPRQQQQQLTSNKFPLKQYLSISRKSSSSPAIQISKDDLQSRDQVDTFLKHLSDEQRSLLYQQLHVEVLTEKYMNELASESHYLSKFGRPCPRGVEDYGTFSELPPKWLPNRIDENEQDTSESDEAKAQSKHVTVRDLWSVGVKNALPFVGFGFLDNLIMIVAGDYIDITIGAALGISTMAAAALGNTISDVAGIASVWYVEHFAEKIGIPNPKLSAAQMTSTSVRWSANIGRALGVIIGCLLGMLPLLFLTTSEGKKEPKE